jgi:hypothetical protein
MAGCTAAIAMRSLMLGGFLGISGFQSDGEQHEHPRSHCLAVYALAVDRAATLGSVEMGG